MPARLRWGTKSTCRNCGEPVAWTKVETFGAHVGEWRHTRERSPEELFPEVMQKCVYEDDQETRRKRTNAEPDSYCSVFQYDTTPRGPCNRKITDVEKQMCGMHARHVRKDERERQKANEKSTFDVDQYVEETLKPIIDDLNKYYGLEAELHRGYRPNKGYSYDGKIVVNGERLMELIHAETEAKIA